jgi:hypothetical protein
MEKINNLKTFRALSVEEKSKIYENEIDRISKYIQSTNWYTGLSKTVKRQVMKYKPWNLYINSENRTPVRLYGIQEYKNNEFAYMVATIEDDKKYTLSTGLIYDIDRIKPISWADIDDDYMMFLIKTSYYGGDVIFLKPEMFLSLY